MHDEWYVSVDYVDQVRRMHDDLMPFNEWRADRWTTGVVQDLVQYAEWWEGRCPGRLMRVRARWDEWVWWATTRRAWLQDRAWEGRCGEMVYRWRLQMEEEGRVARVLADARVCAAGAKRYREIQRWWGRVYTRWEAARGRGNPEGLGWRFGELCPLVMGDQGCTRLQAVRVGAARQVAAGVQRAVARAALEQAVAEWWGQMNWEWREYKKEKGEWAVPFVVGQ